MKLLTKDNIYSPHPPKRRLLLSGVGLLQKLAVVDGCLDGGGRAKILVSHRFRAGDPMYKAVIFI